MTLKGKNLIQLCYSEVINWEVNWNRSLGLELVIKSWWPGRGKRYIHVCSAVMQDCAIDFSPESQPCLGLASRSENRKPDEFLFRLSAPNWGIRLRTHSEQKPAILLSDNVKGIR